MIGAQRLGLVLADLVLVVHAGFVAFVVVGLLLIWIGKFRGWGFIRNIWFRLAHLAAIGFVAAESVTGMICPLTTWENRLRLFAGAGEQYRGSFIQHWLHRVLYFEADEEFFRIVYVVFLMVVLASMWLVPPQWPVAKRNRHTEA